MESIGFDKPFDQAGEELMKRGTDRLRKRDEERHLEMERKREERLQKAASNEKVDLFIKIFDEKKQEIEDTLTGISSGCVDKSDLPFKFDSIVKKIQSLQTYISSSAYFLRVYDIRKSQESLQVLQQRCVDLEETLLPKKKFSFQARRASSKSGKRTGGCEDENREDSTFVLKSQATTIAIEKDSICGFSNRTGENLTLKEEEILKKDIILSFLENCTIRLSGVPSTVHITNLRDCRLVCGPVATSVFIEDCIDSVIVLACQQMRIHNTRHCDFYLHVTSRAIIEDTKEVRFAPYIWKYENVEDHFQVAGLDMEKNNWDYIDDFNWLACDKPSPHWRVLKVNEQDLDWI